MSRILQLALAAHFLVTAATAQDWPMWRGDAMRSAAVPHAPPSELNVQWRRQYSPRQQTWDDPLNLDLMTYDRVFEPIVARDTLVLGFNDQDKVVGLDVRTGVQNWVFYTEAPVRMPPAAADGRVFVCSDDGFLYCLDISNGSLKWKFRGAPNAQHAIGNQRLTSAWPARGGPVVSADTVYFAASIWPFMGTFLYALDAETGRVKWINDESGAQYHKQPHSAPSFAGVAPQGAIVATKELLIVPGGRSVPAVFDRHTGALRYFEINAGGKGTGGSFVSADARHFYVHTRHTGTRAFELQKGARTDFAPNQPVTANGTVYSAETSDKKSVVRAWPSASAKDKARKPLWEIEASAGGDLILAGDTLVAAEAATVTLIKVPSKPKEPPAIRTSVTLDELQPDEAIARLLVASHRLIVVGDKGTILSLGKADTSKPMLHASPTRSRTVDIPARVAELLRHGSAEGYAYWYGPADSDLLRQLAPHSPFEQLAVIDHAADRVDELRSFLDAQGIHGQVTGHVSAAAEFRAPQYTGHMVFVDATVARSPDAIRSIYQSVRPYGGTLVVIGTTDELETTRNLIADMQLEQAELQISQRGKQHSLVITRVGTLPGAADWTHQYGNIANTVKSDDRRVKLPLGILWFGGSSNMDVLPRHGHGPPEQVVAGRLIIQGMNTLSARDVYTGRVLWKREFDDLGTFDVYFDTTYDNTPLNTKYNQVHIPGANGRGTNYVVTSDRVYLLKGPVCLMLDPATGKDVGRIELPPNADGTIPEWGFIGVYEDLLFAGVGFANYRKRHQLEFPKDKELGGNKAGYGSKSYDRAASRGLIAFDRHSGRQLWQVTATHSFWHNGIVAGKGRVYCLDRNPAPVEAAMQRRGIPMPDTYRIVCLNASDGSIRWETNEGITGTWLGYSQEHDMLLQAGARASDRLQAEAGQGMRVYHADDGTIVWKKDNLKYSGPCILHHDLIITNSNSYSASAGAFRLTTGEQKMVRHPLTGKQIPWTMTRAYGCNNVIASENLLTFRSGAAGYYDLTTDSGTGNLGGFKSGCTSNLVVANGVLNAPDYTRTCSCSYQNQTSLGLVHMPDIETWTVNALASNRPRLGSSDPGAGIISSVGINLGAPGDRRDEQGRLWLEYPARAGASPPFSIRYNGEARVFTRNALSHGSGADSWIAASGIENLKELTLDLRLHESPDLASGIPVLEASDDAEESESGSVNLTSSDLELVDDGEIQTVGLRFPRVPFPSNSAHRIRKAWIQFTVDEASEEPASLWIAGQLAANAAIFDDDEHNITARESTKSEVTWSPLPWPETGKSGPDQRTTDLTSVVREIVSLPGWRSGNAMAFLVRGQGKRVASAGGSGREKKAPRLVIKADLEGVEIPEYVPKTDYSAELILAAPRNAEERPPFDIFAQGDLVAEQVKLDPQGEPIHIRIPRVSIGRSLKLRFSAEGAVLNGIALTRRDAE